MRAEIVPSHDSTSLYLRWEIIPEGVETMRMNVLGGPLALEIDTSCFIDTAGIRHETAKIKVPIWPHPGKRNLGQARFGDVDSRRRFWVNLQDAVGKAVVDFVYEAKPGSVPKEGFTVRVPERPDLAPAPRAAAAASPS